MGDKGEGGVKNLKKWVTSTYGWPLRERTQASGVKLDQNTLWITGGSSGETTSELISFGKPPIDGPKLPFWVNRHSMIKVDQKTIYLIGGTGANYHYFAHELSNSTWIIDPTNNFSIKKGPLMNVERPNGPTSAKMTINGNIFIVVAGGTKVCSPYRTSLELLNTSLPNQDWMYGKI